MSSAIILPVVLCGCETWSLTLREEPRLEVFENRILRGILKLVSSAIILPVVLYGCEIWSLTLREELRLRLFENRILNVGPKELIMGSGKGFILSNFIVLYYSAGKVRIIKSTRLRWVCHVARMEEVRSVFKISRGNPIKKGPL